MIRDRYCGHPEGEYHVCSQVERINKLIPAAEKEADRLLDIELDRNDCKLKNIELVAAAWTGHFHAAMNAAAELRGFRRNAPR